MFLSLIKYNRWCSDEVLQNLAILDVILTEGEIFEYENELDALLGREEMLIDDVTICTDISNIFKKYALQYVTKFGIIVDDEMFLNLSLPIITDFLETLKNLNNVPEDLIINIAGILENRDEYTDEDILINIINTLNPEFSHIWLGKLIIDVSDKFIPTLKERINSLVTGDDTNIESNEISEDLLKRNTDLFVNILDNIKNDLGSECKIGTVIPQTLLNKDIIKFYKKFGKYEISMLYKALQLEFDPDKPELIIFKYISDLLPIYIMLDNSFNLDNVKSEISFYLDSLINYKNPEWLNSTINKLYKILEITGYLKYITQ